MSHDNHEQTARGGAELQASRAKYNDDFEQFRCWRYPRPRQIWCSGTSTAPHHRPATTRDLMLDLAVVIILAVMGNSFRDHLESIPENATGDISMVAAHIFWEGDSAFEQFCFGFFLLVMRWVRFNRFSNLFAQNDLLYEVMWLVNMVLFAVAGSSLGFGIDPPCSWGTSFLLSSIFLLDVLVVGMYFYCFILHGLRTGEWAHFRTWIFADLLLTQLVPFILLALLAIYKPGRCDVNFCQLGAFSGVSVTKINQILVWWDFLGSFVLRGLVQAVARKVPSVASRLSTFPVHVGNMIERYHLLLIICLGEQVAAMAALLFEPTTCYFNTWVDSTVYQYCRLDNSSIPLWVYGNESSQDCVAEVCSPYFADNSTHGSEAAASVEELFTLPNWSMMASLLWWLVFERLILFEFNAGEEDHDHAMRRNVAAGLAWRFFTLLMTACVVVIGYTMELVVKDEVPSGFAVPLTLTFALTTLHVTSAVQSFLHSASPHHSQSHKKLKCSKYCGARVQFATRLLVGVASAFGCVFFGPGSFDSATAVQERVVSACHLSKQAHFIPNAGEGENLLHEEMTFNPYLVHYNTVLLAIAAIVSFVHRKNLRCAGCKPAQGCDSCATRRQKYLVELEATGAVRGGDDGTGHAETAVARQEGLVSSISTMHLALEINRRLHTKSTMQVLNSAKDRQTVENEANEGAQLSSRKTAHSTRHNQMVHTSGLEMSAATPAPAPARERLISEML